MASPRGLGWRQAVACLAGATMLTGAVASEAVGGGGPHADVVRNGSIAYAAPDDRVNGPGAWVARSDGSHPRALGLPTMSYRLAWSVDGTWLVAQALQGADTEDEAFMRPVVVRPDGRDARLLHPPGFSDRTDVAPCVWTPAGTRLVCQVTNYYGDHSRDGLWLIDARDGGHPRRLTVNPYPPGDDFGGGDIPGGVSPDGGWVVFTRAQQDTTHPEGQTGALFAVRTDGSHLRQLTPYGVANSHDDALSSWSPDGQTILFGGADGSILTIQPDGRGLTQVKIRGITGFAFARSPTWSPDGRLILARIYLEQAGTWGLYTLTPQGRDLTLLAAPESAEVPVWGSAPNRGHR